jgi:uncharacterized protein YneF (UPF0154 family)
MLIIYTVLFVVLCHVLISDLWVSRRVMSKKTRALYITLLLGVLYSGFYIAMDIVSFIMNDALAL